MNPARQRKLTLLLFILSVITVAAFLVMYALRQNISLFYTPTQVIKGEAAGHSSIRLGGMVVKNSIIRAPNDLSVQFKLTDFNETIVVNYRGILPDLFREGQGIVATGNAIDPQHFNATEILAKHDANYMPPEVKDALAKGVETRGKSSA